ncbi:MAG: hypothetical protein Q9159_000704 [Coniocarpon cinnabarinum]
MPDELREEVDGVQVVCPADHNSPFRHKAWEHLKGRVAEIQRDYEVERRGVTLKVISIEVYTSVLPKYEYKIRMDNGDVNTDRHIGYG